MLRAALFLFLFLGLAPLAFSKESSCNLGQHWVRTYHRRAYYGSDGIFVSATTVSAHCQGNPPGYSHWKDELRTGYPPSWPHKNEKPKAWTEEERDRTLDALGELPETLWGEDHIKIYRMESSTTSTGNPSTSAKGVIVLYNSAFDQSHTLSEVLAHELAHENYRHLSPEDIKSYTEENGWNNPKDVGGPNLWIPTRTNYVEPDGHDSPWEDYANNIQYFLFHPAKLRFVTPSAYDWIKHHFDDNFKIRGRT